MAYRHFWPCFTLFMLYKLLNAEIAPDGCDNPMAIELFNLHSQSITDVPANILVYLCRVNTPDGSEEFLIRNGEKNLLSFQAKDITFELMSGHTFWIDVRKEYSIKGRFKHFNDFEYFHSLVNQDPRCSPKNYSIFCVESCRIAKNSIDINVIELCTGSAVLSQYSVDQKLIDSGAPVFAIEEAFIEKPTNTCLQLKLNTFRCGRVAIGSQVVLSRNEDEYEYYVLRFDTPENAASFAKYICNFVPPEPRFSLPRAIDAFLRRRT